MSTAQSIGLPNSTQYFPPDIEYPGTALRRTASIRLRVHSLTSEQLNSDWESVRQNILWAGGLRHIPDSRAVGAGYTGHSFNDYNHCDLTAMVDDASANENDGRVAGIHFSNKLGNGIRIASTDQEELGPGGSWSTCMIGCAAVPPQDVAHVQFRARIAFKLVWAPPAFTSFVLVDDDGNLLSQGSPTGILPNLRERRTNYEVVRGSKYAVAANNLVATAAPTPAPTTASATIVVTPTAEGSPPSSSSSSSASL